MLPASHQSNPWGLFMLAGRRTYPIYFVLPALAVFLTLFIAPTVTSFYYSLTNWNIHARSVDFVGFDNFRRMLSDKKLLAAIWHTLVYAGAVTVLRNAIGLMIALILNMQIVGRNVLRTVIFLPFVIAPIIIGYLFSALYHPGHGLINQMFRAAGLSVFAIDWLNDPRYALMSTILVDVWRTSGFAMVIYLAGLQLIPAELYESANLDGAGAWSRFRHVTFPLLASSFTVNMVISLIGTMKVFVMILVLTNRGPGYATEVFNTYIMSSFSLGLYGYATAANLLLFLLITIIGLPVLFVLRRREVEL
jgi:raffinose/stachyose/melibiose transport system permease protein